MIVWLQANAALILGVLFGISEALALIPSVAANGVFQAVYNILKGLVAKAPTDQIK